MVIWLDSAGDSDTLVLVEKPPTSRFSNDLLRYQDFMPVFIEVDWNNG